MNNERIDYIKTEILKICRNAYHNNIGLDAFSKMLDDLIKIQESIIFDKKIVRRALVQMQYIIDATKKMIVKK